MEGYIGEIRMFAGNFAPLNWAFCNGQLMPINTNQALFSIIGTIYGGDGRTNFALPDLRGRAPIGPGSAPGLSNIREGQQGGQELQTLTINNMPSHNHPAELTGITGTINCGVGFGSDSADPSGKYPGKVTGGSPNIYNSTSGETMAADAISLNGGNVAVGNNGNGQSFDIRNPYVGIYYIVCLQGIFPSRS